MDSPTSQKQPCSRFAFTLVELLVVMAIIGVLAGLVTTLSGPARAKSKVVATQAQIEKVKLGIEEYKLAYGRYPAVDSAQELIDVLFAVPRSKRQRVFVEFDDRDLEGTNIWKDAWGNEFAYNGISPERNPDAYDLFSKGPNGEADDDDDIPH